MYSTSIKLNNKNPHTKNSVSTFRLKESFRIEKNKNMKYCIDFFFLFCLLIPVTFPETVEEARIEPRTAPLLR
jgi:hypothetical protein